MPGGPGGWPCISILSVSRKSPSLKMKLGGAAGRSYIYSRSECKMPPCPSDKAAPRTSNKDYIVILLYGVCQGQRKGHFFVHGNTIPPRPFSQPPSPPLPPSHTHAGTSCRPEEFLDSSLPQDGSPAVPRLTDFPNSLSLLLGCEFQHSSKEKAVQGGLSA